MSKKVKHPSPYTGLESCEVCWADTSEIPITIYKGIPYCDIDLDKAIQLNREEVYLRNRALVELKASRNRCTDRFIEIYSNAIKNEN